MAKRKLAQPDIKLDLTPMIDVIFLLIIFFILAGKITAEISNENITVPPTKTAEEIDVPPDWVPVKIEVWGNTQDPGPGLESGLKIQLGLDEWTSVGHDGPNSMTAYIRLRESLDRIWDQADKYTDPKTNQVQLPKVMLELRADADTEYRVIQEIQQIASDSNDPNDKMLPNQARVRLFTFTSPPVIPKTARRIIAWHLTKSVMTTKMRSKAI